MVDVFGSGSIAGPFSDIERKEGFIRVTEGSFIDPFEVAGEVMPEKVVKLLTK